MSERIVESVLSDLTSRIGQIQVEQRMPGLALGIVCDQELVWSKGFGYADSRTRRTPDARTLFRVASITKTFTATAILQLRDEGGLSLDDPLHQHLPEFAAAKVRTGTVEQITLRRLLTHHSGLATEAPLPCWDADKFPTREEMLAALPDTEIVLRPDVAFKYSNLAFGLLGEVIARVSGLPYSEYLQARILEPLGMRSSVLEVSDDLKRRLAVGYYACHFDDGFDPAPYVPLNGLAACGQLYSSVEDLACWISLQFQTSAEFSRHGAQVLCGESLAEMHRPQHLESDWSVGYCLGWRANRAGNRVFHGHGGALPGYASYVLFSKPHKLGIICLANTWPHPGLLSTAVEVAEILLQGGWTVPDAKSAAVPGEMPPNREALLGTYEALQGIFATVAFRKNSLRLEKSPLGDYLLHAPALLEPTAEPNEFLVRGGRASGERLVFQFAADGLVSSFALGGFVYRKLTHVATP